MQRVTVQEEFFQFVTVRPMLGRLFLPEDYRATTGVAALSWRLWQEFLAGDPAVVGRSIMIAEQPVTVVAVLPKGFEEPSGTSV